MGATSAMGLGTGAAGGPENLGAAGGMGLDSVTALEEGMVMGHGPVSRIACSNGIDVARDPRDILSAARVIVAAACPYYVSVIYQLRPTPLPKLGTMAVDAGWRLYWDPDIVSQWGAPTTAAVIIHEIGHIIRRHADRKEDRDAEAWNIAGDMEINDDQPDDFPLPEWRAMPDDIQQPRGLTGEHYYQHLPIVEVTVSADGEIRAKWRQKPCKVTSDGQSRSGKPREITDRGRPKPCGGCAGNPIKGEGEGDLPAPISDAAREITIKRVAAAIREHVKNRGTVPGSLMGWAEQELSPPTIPWRRRLASLVRASCAVVSGNSDYSRRRPGRRYWALRKAMSKAPITPTMVRHTPRIGAVLDVSGSMKDELAAVFSEVIGMMQSAEVVVYAADTKIRTEVTITRVADLRRLDREGGLGGTSMDAAMREAIGRRRHDLLIVLTDGQTPWPAQDEMRGVRMLAVITPKGDAAPDWIPQVRIND